MKIFKDEKGFREVNPHWNAPVDPDDPENIYDAVSSLRWQKFENKVTHHDCPELTNAQPGEVYEAELVWRAKIFGDTEWKIMPDNHEPINAMGVINEQIFRLIPEKGKEPELKPYFAQVSGEFETEVYAENIYKAFEFVLKQYKEKFGVENEFDGYDISCHVWCSYTDKN